MLASLFLGLLDRPRKTLSMRPADLEAAGKRAADVAAEAVLFDAALKYSGLTDKEATYEMGYANQGVISKWRSGLERVQWTRILNVRELRVGLFIALGHAHGDDIDAKTTLTVKSRVSA